MNKTAQPSLYGKKGKLQITALHSRCIGAAVCVAQAKGSFVLNQNNKVLIGDLRANPDQVLISAAQNCPTQALLVYKNKKQIWPPAGTKDRALRLQGKTKMKFD